MPEECWSPAWAPDQLPSTVPPLSGHLGAPGVTEQKTTLTYKSLFSNLYTQRVCHPSFAGNIAGTNVDENPFAELNSTLIVENTRGFCLRQPWAKPFVFFLTIDRESTDRCFLYACYGN